MEIQKDLLLLKYSENFNIRDIEEREIDLNLTANEDKNCSVIGTVTDADGNPVSGATIKLFDANGKPFKHMLTDDDGSYNFENLAPGSYSVTAVKNGSKLTVPNNIVLVEEEIKVINFTLTTNISVQMGVITGVLFDEETKERIGGAKISILDEETKTIVATTFVADDGEFVFYDVPSAKYLLIATKSGYETSSPISITIKDGAIINFEVKIKKDIVSNTGTVNGVIKTNGIAVENVYVGLYLVGQEDEKRTEKLVAYTKTNKQGAYMFGGVAEGNYVVKAKQNKQAK